MTSPVPGSILPGSTVTFTWNAGASNTQYWLYVGTSPGGTQIWNENQGANLTRTVIGIPTDGMHDPRPVVVVLLQLELHGLHLHRGDLDSPNLVVSALTGPALASPSQVVNLANTVSEQRHLHGRAFVGRPVSVHRQRLHHGRHVPGQPCRRRSRPGPDGHHGHAGHHPGGVLAQFFCAIADTGGTVAESNEIGQHGVRFRRHRGGDADRQPEGERRGWGVRDHDRAGPCSPWTCHRRRSRTPWAGTGRSIVNGNLSWVTSTGLSTTPAPLATAPPATLTGATLLNLTLPTGTTITNVLFLLNGGSVLASDFITASVVP